MYKVTDFFDISHFPGPHLTNKNLVEGLHLFPDCPHHTQCGIVVTRRMQYIILTGKKCAQEIFYAGLAIAPSHPNNFQVRHIPQDTGSVINIVPVNTVFYRPVHPVHQQNKERL